LSIEQVRHDYLSPSSGDARSLSIPLRGALASRLHRSLRRPREKSMTEVRCFDTTRGAIHLHAGAGFCPFAARFAL